MRRRTFVTAAGAFASAAAWKPAVALASPIAPPHPNPNPTPIFQPKTFAQVQAEAKSVQVRLASIRAQFPAMAQMLKVHVHGYPFVNLGITQIAVNGTKLEVYTPKPKSTRYTPVTETQAPTVPAVPSDMNVDGMNETTFAQQFLPALTQEVQLLTNVVDAFQSAYATHTHATVEPGQDLVAEQIKGTSVPLAVAFNPREVASRTQPPAAVVVKPASAVQPLQYYTPTQSQYFMDALSTSVIQLEDLAAAVHFGIDTHVHPYAYYPFTPIEFNNGAFVFPICQADGLQTVSTSRAIVRPGPP